MQWVWVVSPSTCFFLIGFCVRWEKTNVSHCVSAAVTWTTVRRLRFQRTTSTRARRTSDPSVSTCWGFWAKVDMERCTVHTLSQSHCRVYYAACLFVYIFIKFLFQVFQVRKVAGAASGTIFAMKVLKKVINYFSSCCFFFLVEWRRLFCSENIDHPRSSTGLRFHCVFVAGYLFWSIITALLAC